MTSVYHPQTDGSSEQINKTVNQSIHFHIGHNQKGWVCALPSIRFCIMNIVNASTRYSGFQTWLRSLPQIIPPIVPTSLPMELHSAALYVSSIIKYVAEDVTDAQDNLHQSALYQAATAKASHGPEVIYNMGNKVMLSTFHRWWQYKQKGDGHTAKFFPRWDGPYEIIKSHPESSSYALNDSNLYPYYASELKPYYKNDVVLFPYHELPKLGPILTPEGTHKNVIEWILDMRKHGHSYQYLVSWVGFGPKDNKWLPWKTAKLLTNGLKIMGIGQLHVGNMSSGCADCHL